MDNLTLQQVNLCASCSRKKVTHSLLRPSLADQSLLDRDDERDAETRWEASKSMFSRNRVEPARPPVVIRDGSLRQRGGVAAPVEIEASLLQPDEDAPVRGDSMSLFATLVPPPLRKSKKNFTSGEQWWIRTHKLLPVSYIPMTPPLSAACLLVCTSVGRPQTFFCR